MLPLPHLTIILLKVPFPQYIMSGSQQEFRHNKLKEPPPPVPWSPHCEDIEQALEPDLNMARMLEVPGQEFKITY